MYSSQQIFKSPFHQYRSASPISDRENNDIGINLDYIHIIKSLKQKQNNKTELNEVTNEKIIPTSSIVGINSLQPFMKNKNSMYKPIVFNPINKNKFAQPLM